MNTAAASRHWIPACAGMTEREAWQKRDSRKDAKPQRGCPLLRCPCPSCHPDAAPMLPALCVIPAKAGIHDVHPVQETAPDALYCPHDELSHRHDGRMPVSRAARLAGAALPDCRGPRRARPRGASRDLRLWLRRLRRPGRAASRAQRCPGPQDERRAEPGEAGAGRGAGCGDPAGRSAASLRPHPCPQLRGAGCGLGVARGAGRLPRAQRAGRRTAVLHALCGSCPPHRGVGG